MADEKVVSQLTPEEQKQIAFLEQSVISSRWMLRHPEFSPSKDAAEKLGAYITTNKLLWTEESLEQAFEAVKGELKLDLYEPPVPPPPPPPVEPTYPWGNLKTKQDLNDLTSTPEKRRQYGKWLSDPRFVKIVNRILAQGDAR